MSLSRSCTSDPLQYFLRVQENAYTCRYVTFSKACWPPKRSSCIYRTLGDVTSSRQTFPRRSTPRAWLGQMDKSLPSTPGQHRPLPTNLCTNPTTPDTALSPTIYSKYFKGLKNQPLSFVTCVQVSLAPLSTLDPAEWASKGKGYHHHHLLKKKRKHCLKLLSKAEQCPDCVVLHIIEP